MTQKAKKILDSLLPVCPPDKMRAAVADALRQADKTTRQLAISDPISRIPIA